jgi:hypothetical protein
MSPAAAALPVPSSPRGPGSHDGSDGPAETRPGSPPVPRYPWSAAATSAVSRLLLASAAFVIALPSSTGAQSVPAFSGRYRFIFTVSRGCPSTMQVGPLSVVMNLTEAAITAGAEVSGESASPSEDPANGRFVLQRVGTRLHGPSAASTIEVGLVTEGQYRIWMRVMTDGAAAVSSGGRARGSGTALGEVELSLASDPSGNPIPGGYCNYASDHQWSLEPA